MPLSFELTNETRELEDGETVYRIRATRDIPYHNVKAGDLGGWVSSAHVGDLPRVDDKAWVADNASITDDARISGHAYVSGEAYVTGYSVVTGHARIGGEALIADHARVSDRARITHNAWIHDCAWVGHDVTVTGHAEITGHAQVLDGAWIGGSARVNGHACISGYTRIGGDARVGGNAHISSDDAEILDRSHCLTISPYHGVCVTLYRTRGGGHLFQIGDTISSADHLQDTIRREFPGLLWEDAWSTELLSFCAARIAEWEQQG